MESLDFLHVIVRFRICRLVYYNLRCFCRKMDSIPLDIWRFPELISPLITLSIYFCSYLMLTFIACAFVRARVCVFVFLDFHRKGFLPLQQWCLQYTWLYKSTILWCEYYSRCFCQVSLSPFLNMSYLTSKDESPASQQYNTLY